MIRVFLVDDHELIRFGLENYLNSQENLKVIGIASHGAEALKKIPNLKPDITIIDMQMPDMSGIELIHKLKALNLPTKYIILTGFLDKQAILNTVQVGGSTGYVLKSSPSHQILEAIQTVYNGENYFSELPQEILLEHEKNPKSTKNPLTKREQEILILMAQGYDNKKISQTLCISSRTVSTHRQNMMDKLNIHSSYGLIRYAFLKGLVEHP